MYPIVTEADWTEKQSRLTTFFRILMLIPVMIVGTLWALIGFFALIGAWFAILFTGRYPAGLYDFVGGLLRFTTRLNAYALIVTDRYPPFGLAESDYPLEVRVGPAQEKYSRLTVFFRWLLAIPAFIGSYIALLVAEVIAIANWFVVLFTGKLPKGLHDVTTAALAYTARVNAYAYLLTDAYPPLTDLSVPPPRALGPGHEPPSLATPESPAPPQPPGGLAG